MSCIGVPIMVLETLRRCWTGGFFRWHSKGSRPFSLQRVLLRLLGQTATYCVVCYFGWVTDHWRNHSGVQSMYRRAGATARGVV